VGVSYRREYGFKVDISSDACASPHLGLDLQPATDFSNPIFHMREPNALGRSVLDVEA
jgi:hypothetical protein